ncbi:MAG: hypothetical protein IJA52_06850 [Clostridia bacterium]|nr:hypothetical protein [Clostridia bacterium]
MTYTIQYYSDESSSVAIPVFTPTSAKGREEDSVRRINDFYSELKRSVMAYAKSEAFPKGAKYYVRTTVEPSEEGFEITAVLRLRSRGATIRKRELYHLWQDGVITKTNQTEKIWDSHKAPRVKWISARLKKADTDDKF